MSVLLPIVVGVNFVANAVLRLLGVRTDHKASDTLGREELRTLLFEAGHHFSPRHRGMLLRILDLESVVVEDVMVHRNDVRYLDLDDSWPDLIEQLRNTTHTRLPVCHGSLDQVVGILPLRRVTHLLADDAFDLPACGHCSWSPTTCPRAPRSPSSCCISSPGTSIWRWWSTNTATRWA